MTRRLTLYTLAITALLAVFALYTRPDFLLTLANQVWTCFSRVQACPEVKMNSFLCVCGSLHGHYTL